MASRKLYRSVPVAARFVSVIRKASWLLGIAALVALATGAVGPATSATVVGVALIAPGTARQSAIRLRRAPQRLRMRQAFIETEAAKAFTKRFRRGNNQPKLLRKTPSTQPSATPSAARPTAVYNVAPGEYSRTCRELAWTGSALTVTDRRGSTLTWETVSGGVLRGTRLRPPTQATNQAHAPAPDLGDLLVAEITATKARLLPLDRVHLLDRWSRRLATVPVLGVTEEDLAALAAHAGVSFTVYEIPARVKATPEALVGALFPRSVRYRRPSGVGPEWRWLERVRLVTRVLKGFAEDALPDPQADLAMRRAGKGR